MLVTLITCIQVFSTKGNVTQNRQACRQVLECSRSYYMIENLILPGYHQISVLCNVTRLNQHAPSRAINQNIIEVTPCSNDLPACTDEWGRNAHNTAENVLWLFWLHAPWASLRQAPEVPAHSSSMTMFQSGLLMPVHADFQMHQQDFVRRI
jgi:hypothetical protein